jgi:hypothetical protein
MLVRLLVAGGILVANGVLLVVVLRVLVMVVIRRVKPAAIDYRRAVPVTVRAEQRTAVVEPRPEPAAAGMAMSAAPLVFEPRVEKPRSRYRIHHHRMLLGVPALAVIFAAGAWLGDWVGNGGSAAAAATQTVRLRGSVVYTPGSTVQVRVPATTVSIGGTVVTVPATVIVPGAGKTSFATIRIPTTITTPTTIPTTITATVSVPTTVTQTDTTTVPVTVTVTQTETTTQTDTTTVTQTATT